MKLHPLVPWGAKCFLWLIKAISHSCVTSPEVEMHVTATQTKAAAIGQLGSLIFPPSHFAQTSSSHIVTFSCVAAVSVKVTAVQRFSGRCL